MKPAGIIALFSLFIPLSLGTASAASFQTVQTTDLSATAEAPYAAAFADFNGDGNIDLALAVSDGASHNLRIFSGDGSGSLTFAIDLPIPSPAGGLLATDLSADDMADLAVSSSADNSISVFLCNGDGTFQARADYGVGSGPRAITAGDFRGDGVKDDLAVVNSGESSIAILLNNGSGTMTATDSGSWPASPTALAGIATGDFDGDGSDDIVTARSGSGVARFWFGSGIGTFTGGNDVTVGASPLSLASADLDRDGLDDVAVVNNQDATLSIIRGDAGRTLLAATPQATASPPDSSASPVAVAIGDLNRDGIEDMAVANATAGSISVFSGRGDGTFAAPESFATGGAPSMIAFADLDGSGNDLLSASTTALSYSLLFNNSLPAAGLLVTPGSYDFGNFRIGHITYLSKLLSLTNNGSAPLSVSAMNIGGTDSGDFQLSLQEGASCGGLTPTIPPGSSCSVLLKFINPITEGARFASVNIASNVAVVPTVSVPVSGNGIHFLSPYKIRLKFLGLGNGTVTFSSSDSPCSDNCERTPLSGGILNLTPAPASGSLMHGWAGCDSVQFGVCNIDMGVNSLRDRNITVNFGLVPNRVLLVSGMTIYTETVGEAYGAAAGGELIKMTSGFFGEDLYLGRALNVTLMGGYDNGFISRGTPAIMKSITIAAGSAVLDNIVLR